LENLGDIFLLHGVFVREFLIKEGGPFSESLV
jgi:hypothetical protein